MKRSDLGAVFVLAALVNSGSAMAATGEGVYDPYALDQFIAQSLAADAALTAQVPSAFELFDATEPTIVAQDAQRFDSEGYLIGPDGQRIMMPLKPRWRVGVFR